MWDLEFVKIVEMNLWWRISQSDIMNLWLWICEREMWICENMCDVNLWYEVCDGKLDDDSGYEFACRICDLMVECGFAMKWLWICEMNLRYRIHVILNLWWINENLCGEFVKN